MASNDLQTPADAVMETATENQALVSELRRTASDWQKQFHQLESLCIKRGLKVGYGEKGEVTLS